MFLSRPFSNSHRSRLDQRFNTNSIGFSFLLHVSVKLTSEVLVAARSVWVSFPSFGWKQRITPQPVQLRESTLTRKRSFTCNKRTLAYTSRWLSVTVSVSSSISTKVNSLWTSCRNSSPFLNMQLVTLLTGCCVNNHKIQVTHWFVHY